MKLIHVERVQLGLVVGVSLLSPLAFFRGIGDTFDLTKATVVWLVAAAMFPLLVQRSKSDLPKPVRWSVLALMAALALSTVTSVRPWQSVFGQYQRNTGLLTLGACLVFLVSSARLSKSDRSASWILGALSASAFVAGGYSIIQNAGLDPWDWMTPGQDRPVFGTLGNSNTSGGFISCCIPVLVSGLQGSHSARFKYAAGLAAIFSAGAVGILGAFQGVVAGAFGSVAILVVASLRKIKVADLCASALNTAVVLFSLFWVDTFKRLLIVLTAALVFQFLSMRIDQSKEVSVWRSLRASRIRQGGMAIGLGSFVFGTVVLLGSEISRQVSDGLRERKYFFQAAWRIFSDNPVVGSGLETYGLMFTRYRPEAHGATYEFNRSSSAHSIVLGMFSNGGIVLGLAYLVFVGSIGYVIVRKWSKVTSHWLYAGVAVAWVATQIQSTVSVEHVALFVQQFILAGVVVGVLWFDRPATMSSHRAGRSKDSSVSVPVLSVGLVVALLSAFPLTRPIRADGHGLWSLRYAAVGDLQRSLEEARRASELAPWSSQQRIRLAQALYDVRDDEYGKEADEVAKLVDFSPPYGIEAAYRVAESGDFSRGADLADLALVRDPHSQGLRESVADLYRQFGDIYRSQGQIDQARLSYVRAIEIDGSPSISAAARQALDALGG